MSSKISSSFGSSQKQQLKELLNEPTTNTPQPQNINWIARYNQVIDAYHKVLSTESTPLNAKNSQTSSPFPRLEKLQCDSSIYKLTSKIINNSCFNIFLILALLVVPVINILVLALLISYALFVKNQIKKHIKNLEKLCKSSQDSRQDSQSKIFEYFYYYPDMCAQVGRHFCILNLSVEAIQDFKFNDAHQKLRDSMVKSTQVDLSTQQDETADNFNNIEIKKSQQLSTTNPKNVNVPIYDQYFYDSFNLVNKELYKAASWVVLGLLLIVVSVVFYSTLFGLI